MFLCFVSSNVARVSNYWNSVSRDALDWLSHCLMEDVEILGITDEGLGLGWGVLLSLFLCSSNSRFFLPCSKSASQSEHTEKLSSSLPCPFLSSSLSSLRSSSSQSNVIGYSLEHDFLKGCRLHSTLYWVK